MTIRRRIIIAGVIQTVLICIICAFVYFSFRTILGKLRTIEIIDDLNISVLEMRKAEKNYFLYQDINAISELIRLGRKENSAILAEKEYILSNLGRKTYDDLLTKFKQYVDLASSIQETRQLGPDFESNFRNLGHQLTRLFELLLKQERRNVNRIIVVNVGVLFISLGFILVVQLVFWQFFFRLITKELGNIEPLITKVSQGRFHEVAISSVPSHDEIGIAIEAITDMARELEKRESALMQSGKLASLGVLISGVVHELGNPLNNISLMAQGYLGLYDILGDQEKKHYMEDILTQTERIQKIMRNLLDFSRQKKTERVEHDPGEVVERSIGLVINHIKLANVKLHKSIEAGLPPIVMDAPQIEQVLINLFVNALQAMPHGGDLFVEVSKDQTNKGVVIRVRDTGSGIPKDILPNVFDPFFSTKGTKGTGLGLSVSYGILRQHSGEISVESEEGQGTTFIITLPCHREEEGEGDVE
ncbi:MAG: ATP-binding protein [Syntrophobacterales bacterium]